MGDPRTLDTAGRGWRVLVTQQEASASNRYQMDAEAAEDNVVGSHTIRMKSEAMRGRQ